MHDHSYTGSTDRTKEIAAKYTDRVYDFGWIHDFSAARNYAFSLATCEYIYSADADEVLDGENRERFRVLKEHLLPEVEIVQMKYGNQLQFNTVYNYDSLLIFHDHTQTYGYHFSSVSPFPWASQNPHILIIIPKNSRKYKIYTRKYIDLQRGGF